MHVHYSQAEINPALLRKATYASVAVALVLITIKLIAYIITGSVSLLSSLVDSALDLMASMINLFAVRQSLVPADEHHRFGHGKAEPLAGLGQAAFICGSSVFICYEAVQRILQPVPIQQGTIGIAVMVISLLMSMGLVAYQQYVIKQTNSLAIRADLIHYISDIAINLGVIIALVLTVNFGWLYADPVFAIGIALVILYSVWHIAKQSLDQLMDKELSEHDREKILQIANSYPEIHDVHDLRTRSAGHNRFIQIHLVFDGSATLEQAHAITERVEEDILSAFPGADVIIHQDPR
jgi:ferrous-iron efflux pump FieF